MGAWADSAWRIMSDVSEAVSRGAGTVMTKEFSFPSKGATWRKRLYPMSCSSLGPVTMSETSLNRMSVTGVADTWSAPVHADAVRGKTGPWRTAMREARSGSRSALVEGEKDEWRTRVAALSFTWAIFELSLAMRDRIL